MSSGWTLGHNELLLDTGVIMSYGWIQSGHNTLWLDTEVTMRSGWKLGLQ